MDRETFWTALGLVMFVFSVAAAGLFLWLGMAVHAMIWSAVAAIWLMGAIRQ
jgi:hypothetical protein